MRESPLTEEVLLLGGPSEEASALDDAVVGVGVAAVGGDQPVGGERQHREERKED